MSTTTQRPTPETDEVFDAYARCACGTACIRVRMQLLERERDEAREQLKAMREAIKEAHKAIRMGPYPEHSVLAKLQPFLP